MKILHLNNVASLTGGTGACTDSIIEVLEEDQHAVAFRTGSPPAELFDHENLITAVGGFGNPGPLGKLLEQFAPDLILCHNITGNYYPHELRGIPSVFYHHSAHPGRGSGSNCDREIVVSHHLNSRLRLPDSAVLYQPVTVPEYVGSRSRGVFRIGKVATAGSKKWNLTEMMPLYDQLRNIHPGVQFELVGCGGQFLQEFAAALRIGETGLVRAHPPSRASRKILHRWDVLLSNSNTDETYGRTASEAQLAGCVPIVPNIGGYREQIDHRYSGFLCHRLREFVGAVQTVMDWKQSNHLEQVREQCRRAARLRNESFVEKFSKLAEELVKC